MSNAVLGINFHAHDSSAALMLDGRVVFAAAEERFTRIKKDKSFPRLAIQAALDHGGVRFADLDAIAFGWNRPGLGPLHTIRQSLLGRLPRSRGWTQAQLYHLASELRHRGGVADLVERFGPVPADRVTFVDHHDAHAWSTYALSASTRRWSWSWTAGAPGSQPPCTAPRQVVCAASAPSPTPTRSASSTRASPTC